MDEKIRIMVLDRGRVLVGRVSRHPELAFHWYVQGARVIRRWGTTRGLEQIANDGPTKDTVLDDPCDTDVPFRAVLEIKHVREEKWRSHLKN